VPSPISGAVDRVFVAVGDQVSAGDVLATVIPD
jgi:biotin carboxyl carrier protein